jgi:hypothetical protein
MQPVLGGNHPCVGVAIPPQFVQPTPNRKGGNIVAQSEPLNEVAFSLLKFGHFLFDLGKQVSLVRSHLFVDPSPSLAADALEISRLCLGGDNISGCAAHRLAKFLPHVLIIAPEFDFAGLGEVPLDGSADPID